MIGQLVFGSGGPRQGEREKLYGLPVLRVRADMDSFWWERRVKKAGRALFRGGARPGAGPQRVPLLASAVGIWASSSGPRAFPAGPVTGAGTGAAGAEGSGAGSVHRGFMRGAGRLGDDPCRRNALFSSPEPGHRRTQRRGGAGPMAARGVRCAYPATERRGAGGSLLSSRRGQGRGAYAGALRTCTGSGGLSLSAPHLGEGDREDLTCSPPCMSSDD